MEGQKREDTQPWQDLFSRPGRSVYSEGQSAEKGKCGFSCQKDNDSHRTWPQYERALKIEPAHA